MKESLALFEKILHSVFFQQTAMILFLNKKDIFEEKLRRFPLNATFPEYFGKNFFDFLQSQKIFDANFFVFKADFRKRKLKILLNRNTNRLNNRKRRYEKFLWIFFGKKTEKNEEKKFLTKIFFTRFPNEIPLEKVSPSFPLSFLFQRDFQIKFRWKKFPLWFLFQRPKTSRGLPLNKTIQKKRRRFRRRVTTASNFKSWEAKGFKSSGVRLTLATGLKIWRKFTIFTIKIYFTLLVI